MFGQDMYTEKAMATIREERARQGKGLETLAEEISDLLQLEPGKRLTFFRLRAMEQGMTRDVPFPIVIAAGIVLQIPALELIPALDA
jgi:hypothetical protein